LIPQFIYLTAHISQYLDIGYGETAVNQLSGIVQRFHYLFVPALFIRFVAKLFLNKKTILDVILILAHVVVFFAIGDRGSALAILVTFIWLEAYFDNKFELKNYLIPIIISILVIPIVKYYRIYFSVDQVDALRVA